MLATILFETVKCFILLALHFGVLAVSVILINKKVGLPSELYRKLLHIVSVFSIFPIIQAFGTLIGAGGCTAISVALGKKDIENSRSISSFCFWFCIVVGVAIAIILYAFTEPIISMLGAADSYRSFAVVDIVAAIVGVIVLTRHLRALSGIPVMA